MEDRQTHIKEGAGLEESRINTDLIDFLNKWSTPVLMIVLIIVGGYWAKRWWDDKQLARVNDAFFQYEQARAGGNPSPDSLKRVAEEFAGVRGVDLMALLDTADTYMAAARTGLAPGAAFDPVSGKLTNPEQDTLDEATRSQYLADAKGLYERVLVTAEGEDKPMLAAEAAFGIAAVLESDESTLEQAKSAYTRAGELSRSGGYTLLAQVAEQRAAGVGELGELPMLFNEIDLPALPTHDPALNAIDAIKAADTSNLELTADYVENEPGEGGAGDESEPVDEPDPTAVP